MLAVLGDLVEDVVVHQTVDTVHAADTPSTIVRRRGGSAANVAAVAAAEGAEVRFLGQVGDDAIGHALVEGLERVGVECRFVVTAGRTGTVVVLVDPSGERSMYPDRAAAMDLRGASAAWLEGTRVLHVPLYCLTTDPLRSTTFDLARMAHDRGVAVTIDTSSVTLISQLGRAWMLDSIARLDPRVVFANRHEAAALGITGPLGSAVTVVKRGPDPVVVYEGSTGFEVEVPEIERVSDTTGAGDAFAAGWIAFGHPWSGSAVDAAKAGIRAARRLIGAHADDPEHPAGGRGTFARD